MTAFEGQDKYDAFLEHPDTLPRMNATERRLKAQAEPGWLIGKLKSLQSAEPDPSAFWQVWHEANTRLRMVQLGVDVDALKLQDTKPDLEEVPTDPPKFISHFEDR